MGRNQLLIERVQYMRTLRELRDHNIIKVLTGLRRSGKSTLLLMFADELMQKGVAREQIQFYNFEDLNTLALGDIFQIHTHIQNKLVADKMNYIFLDEVQNVKDFQRLVDSLFIKQNCDVYITGSNAHLLSGELATLLTGRYIETEVLPFSYREYMGFLDVHQEKIRKNKNFREDGVLDYKSLAENENRSDREIYFSHLIKNDKSYSPNSTENESLGNSENAYSQNSTKSESFGNRENSHDKSLTGNEILWVKEDNYSPYSTKSDSSGNKKDGYSQNSTESESFGNSENGYPLKSTKSESFTDREMGYPLKLNTDKSFNDFIYLGGIPEVYRLLIDNYQQSDFFVESVLNTILEKDVFARNEIRNKAVFQKVIDFVMDSIGSYVSAKSIADTLTSNGFKVEHKTILNYLSYLCDAKLLHSVPRYEIKGKGLLQSLNKFYLADTCFRRVRLGKAPGQDTGHLLENAVYLELRRRNKRVYVGKYRDKEVDFVVTDYDGYTSYYQVAWSAMTPETLERELKPLNAIKDSNPKYLLTMDDDFNPVYNGIRKIYAVDWFLKSNRYGAQYL